MRRDGAPIDWGQAHALLDRARESIEAAENPRRAEIERILAERALDLGKPIAKPVAPDEVLDLLLFSLAEERYALDSTHVLEVLALGGLTPVPCTPLFILGVINRRGQILPILHLGRLLGQPGPESPGTGRVIAVEAGGMAFGLFADSVAGTLRLDADEVEPPPASGAVARATFLRGVTRDMVAVLDLERLARDPRILVNAEA